MLNYRNELCKLFERHNVLGNGAEIGVAKGRFANEILTEYSGHVFLIDAWAKQDINIYDDIENSEDSVNNLDICLNNLKKFNKRFTIIRKFSEDAVKDIKDESLDFVYIDANHKYDYVKKDIEIWCKKIRKGGIISGHDYLNNWQDFTKTCDNKKDKYIFDENNIKLGCFGVNPAVNEFCKTNNYYLNTTKSDYFGSWYIIK